MIPDAWAKNKVEENELLMGEYVTHSYTKGDK